MKDTNAAALTAVESLAVEPVSVARASITPAQIALLARLQRLREDWAALPWIQHTDVGDQRAGGQSADCESVGTSEEIRTLPTSDCESVSSHPVAVAMQQLESAIRTLLTSEEIRTLPTSAVQLPTGESARTRLIGHGVTDDELEAAIAALPSPALIGGYLLGLDGAMDDALRTALRSTIGEMAARLRLRAVFVYETSEEALLGEGPFGAQQPRKGGSQDMHVQTRLDAEAANFSPQGPTELFGALDEDFEDVIVALATPGAAEVGARAHPPTHYELSDPRGCSIESERLWACGGTGWYGDRNRLGLVCGELLLPGCGLEVAFPLPTRAYDEFEWFSAVYLGTAPDPGSVRLRVHRREGDVDVCVPLEVSTEAASASPRLALPGAHLPLAAHQPLQAPHTSGDGNALAAMAAVHAALRAAAAGLGRIMAGAACLPPSIGGAKAEDWADADESDAPADAAVASLTDGTDLDELGDLQLGHGFRFYVQPASGIWADETTALTLPAANVTATPSWMATDATELAAASMVFAQEALSAPADRFVSTELLAAMCDPAPAHGGTRRSPLPVPHPAYGAWLLSYAGHLSQKVSMTARSATASAPEGAGSCSAALLFATLKNAAACTPGVPRSERVRWLRLAMEFISPRRERKTETHVRLLRVLSLLRPLAAGIIGASIPSGARSSRASLAAIAAADVPEGAQLLLELALAAHAQLVAEVRGRPGPLADEVSDALVARAISNRHSPILRAPFFFPTRTDLLYLVAPSPLLSNGATELSSNVWFDGSLHPSDPAVAKCGLSTPAGSRWNAQRVDLHHARDLLESAGGVDALTRLLLAHEHGAVESVESLPSQYQRMLELTWLEAVGLRRVVSTAHPLRPDDTVLACASFEGLVGPDGVFRLPASGSRMGAAVAVIATLHPLSALHADASPTACQCLEFATSNDSDLTRGSSRLLLFGESTAHEDGLLRPCSAQVGSAMPMTMPSWSQGVLVTEPADLSRGTTYVKLLPGRAGAAWSWGVELTLTVSNIDASTAAQVLEASRSEFAAHAARLLSTDAGWSPSMDAELVELARACCNALRRDAASLANRVAARSAPASPVRAPSPVRAVASPAPTAFTGPVDAEAEVARRRHASWAAMMAADAPAEAALQPSLPEPIGAEEENGERPYNLLRPAPAPIAHTADYTPSTLPLEFLCVFSEAVALQFPRLARQPTHMLRFRFALIRALNVALAHSLPAFGMGAALAADSRAGGRPSASAPPLPIVGRLLRMSGSVFTSIKAELLAAALAATRVRGSAKHAVPSGSLVLDNYKALGSAAAGFRGVMDSGSTWSQAFDQLGSKPSPFWRFVANESQAKAFDVTFKDDRGVDAGGVYREGLARMVEEVQSDAVDLLKPCPNARAQHRLGTDAWVPNPLLLDPAHSPPALIARSTCMFEFLGRLVGLSLRTRAGLPFAFPPAVWRGLTGAPPAAEDLVGHDAGLAGLIAALREWTPPDAPRSSAAASDADSPRAATDFPFAGLAWTVPAVAGGADVPLPLPASGSLGVVVVTPATRLAYADAVEAHALHALDAPLAAMRRGLANVVPQRPLSLLTPSEMEIAVCGSPDVDADVLRAHTIYDAPYCASHPVVVRFWRVFAALTPEERSLYCRFAWGRARLPPAGAEWTSQHKLSRLSGGDAALPQSHTCFFAVDIPEYTTDATMRWGITTACACSVGGILSG